VNVANKETETDNEPETYVRYSAFSREVRQIGGPITHVEDSAEMLAENGTLMRETRRNRHDSADVSL
jgi:hypothetical protein